jgi:hypothetical protein
VVDKQVLTQVPLFSSLDDAALARIAPWFTPRAGEAASTDSEALDHKLVGHRGCNYE